MKNKSDKVVLIGNPNVGKSLIFGYLTDSYVTVSNYPGTTVECSSGKAGYDGRVDEVIDTPGINSLLPFSEDEVVARNILLNERPRLVVQVADAKNVRRALFLSVQLAEMGLPFILNLNMIDEAQSKGVEINGTLLQEILGVPVVKTVAIQRQGLQNLVSHIQNGTVASKLEVTYPKEIEAAASRILKLLPDYDISKRSVALMLLSGDTSLKEWLSQNVSAAAIRKIEVIIQEIQKEIQRSVSSALSQRRLQKAEEIFNAVYHVGEVKPLKVSEFLGRISMHPFWGSFILLAVLYGVYQFVGVLGAGTLVDFIEKFVFGKFVNPLFEKLFSFLTPFPWLYELFIGDYGLLTMALSYAIAIVLPVVATFFLAFGLLEDSGYLPRLAVMMNKIFKALGLHGKAVLPMVLGLGCDTMATLTTRILDTRKERILVTLLLALGIPCSAQLGVILGLLGGLSITAVLIWLVCITGVLFSVGYLASKVLPGECSDFILELPPLRRPSLLNIVTKTIARIEWYLKEAVPLFFLGTFILFVLAKSGVLNTLESWTRPLIHGFLGLPESATQSFLIGFLRRDYGAAGLFDLARSGQLNPDQIVVSLVTMTLFVPCIANFFIIIKERGWKTALAITLFVFPFAFAVGGLLNLLLKAF
ncbi:MAG: ferrous iron transport protein B [bacterium]